MLTLVSADLGGVDEEIATVDKFRRSQLGDLCANFLCSFAGVLCLHGNAYGVELNMSGICFHGLCEFEDGIQLSKDEG